MTPRVKGGLLLILAFLLGAAAGALGFGIYQARSGWVGPYRGARFQEFVLRRLTRELGLKPDQRQQVEAILRDTGEEFRRLREEIRPRYREILGRSRERINGVLDPDQRAKFDVLADEWDRRRGEARGARDPGPARP